MWHVWEVEGIGGCYKQTTGWLLLHFGQCWLGAGSFDASPHPAKKHPANSMSPARQRHLRQPTTTTKLLLQNLQILSYSLQLKTISSLIRNKSSVGRPLLAASCNFMLRWLMSAAKAKPHSSVTKMKDMLCSPSNSLSSVICFVDSLYRWSKCVLFPPLRHGFSSVTVLFLLWVTCQQQYGGNHSCWWSGVKNTNR